MKSDLPIKVILLLALAAVECFYAVAVYADTNDKLDVNLNTIYLGTKSQKSGDVLNEDIVQIPLPLSEHARSTGQGPFGGITYFDIKTLSNVLVNDPALKSPQNQVASVRGLGRIYYSYLVPGDTPHTFVPFVTLYRDLSIDYTDNNGSHSGASVSWLSPAFMYAYRVDERLAWHLDMELYSRTMKGNSRTRFGASYMPSWPWILSASYEHVAWDLSESIAGSDVNIKGYTHSGYLKIILRDPPQGNFAFIIGFDSTHNVNGPLLVSGGPVISNGGFFGIEASGGVLAW